MNLFKTALRFGLPVASAVLIAACGGASAPEASSPTAAKARLVGAADAPASYRGPVAPPDHPGVTNRLPEAPAPGSSRAGQVYNVYIQAPGTGDKVAFTVFEPATLTGGRVYPLVLHSHGFGGSRQTSLDPSQCSQCLVGLDAPVGQLVANGYGVISIDERGHGESGGKIRVMDPDAEGQNLLAVLDWAEAKLGWLAFGRSADGRDRHNLVVGTVGGSYGGMFQYLLHNIDPRHRLDAMVPEFAPNNLNNSLFPGGVAKTNWNLFLAGANAHKLDPYITQGLVDTLLSSRISAHFADFFYYHSNQYFCSNQTVATNGGLGTSPRHLPTAGTRVNALLFQGVRDTLFNFNEGHANYQCLKALGGDVRLLSYQKGHNTVPIVPDVGGALFLPLDIARDSRCGRTDVADARLAFFEEHLKGIAGAANAVPRKPCLSIAKDDAVLVNQVMTAKTGGLTEFAVPPTTVVSGLGLVPAAIELDISRSGASTVVAGIPRLQVRVTPTVPGMAGDPILFVGLGQSRHGVPGAYDLVNNQVMPLRGQGAFDLDMAGVTARLGANDKLALLIYGQSEQYLATAGLNPGASAILPVTVTGKVAVPVLPKGSYQAAP